MKVAIVGAGEFPAVEQGKRILEKADYIIAADGGYTFLRACNSACDLWLGDGDSYRGEEPDCPKKRFPVEKDDTDFSLAIQEALQRGAKELYLLGATGTRLDHTLSNIFHLAALKNSGITWHLWNSHNYMTYLTDGVHRLSAEEDKTYAGFLAYPNDVRITLEGFYYETDRVLLRRGSSLGVSNSFTTSEATVWVEGDGVFYIASRD